MCPQAQVLQPDELHDAHSPVAPLQQAPLVAARCVNGTILRPSNAEDDHPSTACQQSEVCAPGGVPLGRGTPGQHQSPGGRRGRDIDPIHCSGHLCTPSRRQQEEEAHQEVLPIQGMAALVNGVIKAVIHQEEHWIRRRHWVRRSKNTSTATPSTRRRKSRRRIRSRFDAERNSTPADRRRSR